MMESGQRGGCGPFVERVQVAAARPEPPPMPSPDKAPFNDAVELLAYLGSASGALRHDLRVEVEEPSTSQSSDGRRARASASGEARSQSKRPRPLLRTGTMCSHCGSQSTPRWWRDISPEGVVCNACGIWLKRHGSARPVQFFSEGAPSPRAGAAGTPPAAAAAAGLLSPLTAGRPADRARDGGVSSPQPAAASGAAAGDFYLINGRPKRRWPAQRALSTLGGEPGASDPAPGAEEDHNPPSSSGNPGEGPTEAKVALDSLDFSTAGDQILVLRRRLFKVRGPDGRCRFCCCEG